MGTVVLVVGGALGSLFWGMVQKLLASKQIFERAIPCFAYILEMNVTLPRPRMDTNTVLQSPAQRQAATNPTS